ncbi:MAG: flagellar hook-basal body complex protein FliE [Acidimicrobiia bacterium]
MAIAPIGAVGSLGKLAGAPALDPAPLTKPAGDGFGAQIVNALDGLQATQNKADALGVKAATGTAQDVSDYMIAATQASLATELTVAVRNKAVEAFNDIMRMNI